MRHTLAALRALIVLPFPPDPEGGAAARCAIALLRGLADHGVHCRALAATGRPVTAASGSLDDLPVEVMRVPLPGRWRARVERLVEPQRTLRVGPFAERLRALAADADVVHFVDTHTAVAMDLVDRPALAQLDRVTRLDRDLNRPWRREDRDGLVLWRTERRVCRRSRWLLTNSEKVAQALAEAAPRAEVAIAPLGLDPVRYDPPAHLGSDTVGLIGTASWPPTANAVRRLLARVWPLVRARRPGAQLHLAGRGMVASAFGELAAVPGVRWAGAVPSASDFLRELGVMLYPLGRGSGTKVKVLEALAVGLPVVTTPDGAEGVEHSEAVTVSDDDEQLAAATVALLEDVDARRAAGAAGRRTFAEHHTPAAAAAPVVELYERMTG